MKADVRSHFGLHVLPFTREIKVEQQWPHEQFVRARQELREVVEERMSAALLAPAGSGKSQVLRALVAGLPRARFRVSYVKVCGLSKRDFCRHLAQAVGARAAGHTASLVHSLQARVSTLNQQESQRLVLVVDEAHDLRAEVLGLLRLLTNFEMDSQLVLSVLLCGQPPLRQMLRRADMEAVSRRLALYEQLRNLDRQETRDYVLHRLRIAGADRELLSPSGHDALFECSQGNLRACDRIALASLKMAASRKADVVDAELVALARHKVWP